MTPVLKDATELMKEINKIKSKHSGLPDVSNQIEHKEDFIDTEVTDTTNKNILEDKSDSE